MVKINVFPPFHHAVGDDGDDGGDDDGDDGGDDGGGGDGDDGYGDDDYYGDIDLLILLHIATFYEEL